MMTIKSKPRRIIFLGVQGSGKSTQAEQLALYFSLPYIEMGQLFRDKATNQSPQAKVIKEAIDAGQLIPDEVAIKTLHQRLKQKDCQNGYVLDGYPRNSAQLMGLPNGIDQVFYIKVSDEEAIRRLLARRRHDDKRQSIENRIAWHHRETEPLLDHFKGLGILTEIDGQKTIEQVHRQILDKLKNGSN